MHNLKKRILIIDDGKDIHDDYRKLFDAWYASSDSSRINAMSEELFGKDKKPGAVTNSGDKRVTFEIFSAYQGQEGLEMIRKAREEGNPYHVAFVDIRMPPGWDGLQTIQEIIKIDSEIQFVVCSAYSDRRLDEFLSIAGAEDRLLLIKKPFDPVEVILHASSMAEKWMVGRLASAKMVDLEKMVEQRTAELRKEIAEREKAEAERESMRAMMVQTSRLASLGEMAAGIAHEINNPLAIISGNCTLVKRQAEAGTLDMSKLATHAAKMNASITRIADIIRGLRTFSREPGEGDMQECSVPEVLKMTLDLCQSKLESLQIALDVSGVGAELKVFGNPVQISQVLLNLLSNAKDAIEALPEKWIKVVATETPDSITLSIIDSGHGIPEQIRDKLMRPFFTTKEIGKGTGLGLSISHGIMQQHGGKLSLDALSANTKFDVVFPKKKKMPMMLAKKG